MKQRKRKKGPNSFHNWPMSISTSGGAEAWAYPSRSGKSLEVYVRPLDEIGESILPSPVKVRIRMSYFPVGPQWRKRR